MLYLFIALIAASFDIATKALVSNYIEFGRTVDVLPGIVGLTAVKNTGVAFSMFADSGWMLTAVIAALILVLTVMILAGKKSFTGFELFCLALVLGGALGNLADRLVNGYVLDMIEIQFVDFAVFNFADSCITVGCILFAIAILFFHRKPQTASAEEPESHQDEKSAADEAAAKLTAAADEAEKAADLARQTDEQEKKDGDEA